MITRALGGAGGVPFAGTGGVPFAGAGRVPFGGAGGVPFAGAGGIPFALPPKPSRCRVIALLMVLLWDRFDGLRRRCLAGEHLIPGMGGRQQQCLETGRKGPFSWLGI